MRPTRVLAIVLTSLFLVAVALGGDPALELATAHGSVTKADKEAVTIQPRTATGKFGKSLVLKITGSSKLTQATREKRGGKLVPVQRDLEAKELEAGQAIAVIYTAGADPVLLSAVVQRVTK